MVEESTLETLPSSDLQLIGKVNDTSITNLDTVDEPFVFPPQTAIGPIPESASWWSENWLSLSIIILVVGALIVIMVLAVCLGPKKNQEEALKSTPGQEV